MNLGLQDLALFSFTVLVLNATPGVDMLYAVSRALQGGLRTGMAASAGITAGCMVHIALAASGLAALLAVASWAFHLITWVGAAYLAWLAWGMLHASLQPAPRAVNALNNSNTVRSTANALSAPQQDWDAFRQGLLTNILNPKVALFVLAFLPQFIASDSAHKTLAFLALGAVMVAQGAVFLAALVVVTVTLQRRLSASTRVNNTRSSQITRSLNACGGLLFLALAVRIVTADAPGLAATSAH